MAAEPGLSLETPPPEASLDSRAAGRLTPEQVRDNLTAASQGDMRAWERIVSSYVGLVWSITRQYRLSTADAGDVCQTTWLRLVENIDDIQDPTRLGGWLATTSRRECMRVLAKGRRQVPVAEADLLIDAREPSTPGVDRGLLDDERAREVQRAIAKLPERYRRLLAMLMQDPPPSYEVISQTLNMPVGSIGPTRGRCLRRLQQLLREGEAGSEGGLFD